MGLWAQMKTWFILHLLIGYIFIASGLIVCFLMLLATIFIWPFNKSLYRKTVVNLAYSHWCHFTTIAQWWSGSNVTIHMEDPHAFDYVGKEHTIVIMNHKYDIDWLMTWILAERTGILGGTKIYGKSSLRFLPLLGWQWVFTESIFLKRDWEKDKKSILRDLHLITEYPPNYNVTLLLFCEGTRFTEEKHRISNEVARKKGIPELKHHLLPRTKGFVLSMNGVKGKIPSILDLTIGFRDDGAKPTLMSVLYGKACKAEIYARRIPIESVPTDTDEACGEWLNQHYREKDEIYDNFVQNGHFTIGSKMEVARRPHDLLVWIFWAILTCVPLFYWLGNIIRSGSWMAQLGLLVGMGLVSVAIRLMIQVSEIDSGSKYGNKGAASNDKKES